MNNTEHSCSNTQLGARCYDEMESAGEILKVCREAKGLSLDDVSEELKILKRNLSLLENDRAHHELTLLFAKGYLKNYAQFLGLDVKALESKWKLLSQDKTVVCDAVNASQEFDAQANDSKAHDVKAINSKTINRKKGESHSPEQSLLSGFLNRQKQQTNHKAYYGVAAVFAIMGCALWLNTDPVLSPSVQPTQVTVETPKGITTELLASESSEPPSSPITVLSSFYSQSNTQAQSNIQAQSDTLGASIQNTALVSEMTDAERASWVAQLRQEYSESADAKPLAAVVSYSANSLNQQDETILRAGETGISTMLTSESQSELSFFFSDDCWIKVVDGQNRIVYEAVAKQNESLELEGTPPFKVTLGYAPAVQVSYNGEPVEINTRQGRNVARIVLGS